MGYCKKKHSANKLSRENLDEKGQEKWDLNDLAAVQNSHQRIPCGDLKHL